MKTLWRRTSGGFLLESINWGTIDVRPDIFAAQPAQGSGFVNQGLRNLFDLRCPTAGTSHLGGKCDYPEAGLFCNLFYGVFHRGEV